ncbi:MAG: gas vesicle protein GvpO [Pseudomonadota bacterium]
MIDPAAVHRVIETVSMLTGERQSLEGITSVSVADDNLHVEAEFLEGRATLTDNDRIAAYAIIADCSGNVSSFRIIHRSIRSARFAKTDDRRDP